MKQNLTAVALCAIALFSFTELGHAQNSETVTCSGNDLHYLGYVMLTGDTLAWANIQNDDVYHLSRGIYHRNDELLNYVQENNLYFFGHALITAKRDELDKVAADDWFYLGSAMFERTVAYLENISDDDVYYLGRAILERDINHLNKLSGE